MRKLLISFVALFVATRSVQAAFSDVPERNPFSGDYKRQVPSSIGSGVHLGFLIPPPPQFVQFSLVHFQYSLPTTFFELHARKSINVATTIGYAKKYGWDWPEYSIPLVFLSEDVALLQGETWYFGTGLGVGMQAQQNERI